MDALHFCDILWKVIEVQYSVTLLLVKGDRFLRPFCLLYMLLLRDRGGGDKVFKRADL